MTEDIKNILEEYKKSLLDELQVYVDLVAKNAKWRLEFWKKHKKDLEGVQQYDLVSTFDLPAYYAYGNAKDIVEDKFKEIIDKYKD
jgi:hypothetical protein